MIIEPFIKRELFVNRTIWHRPQKYSFVLRTYEHYFLYTFCQEKSSVIRSKNLKRYCMYNRPKIKKANILNIRSSYYPEFQRISDTIFGTTFHWFQKQNRGSPLCCNVSIIVKDLYDAYSALPAIHDEQ